MILKFQTIKGHAGDVRVLSYIQAGSDQATPLFTNMAGGSVQELAREVAALRGLRPKLNKAGAHLILNHSPDQRALTEAEWREALEIALAEHGAQDAPYAAYMHTDKEHQHLHVYLLRIRSDGSVVKDSNSWRTNERAARAIEARFGLDPPKPRASEDRWPRDGGAGGERGRRRFERLTASQSQPDQQPQKGLKVINPHLIFEAIDASKDLDELRERLLKKGIESRLIQSLNAQHPTGWMLRQVGPAGTWKKGSEVHRDLSIKNALDRMRERQAQGRRASPNPYERGHHDAPRQRLGRSGGSLMSVLSVIGIELSIHLVAGFINLIARVLARKAEVPEDTLGRIDVVEDGTPVFVEPVDLQVDAPADQHARLDAARTVLARAMDQTVEAILQDDTSKLPTLSDPEVVAERARVISELDQIDPEDGDGDGDSEDHYERERPR